MFRDEVDMIPSSQRLKNRVIYTLTWVPIGITTPYIDTLLGSTPTPHN